MEMEDQYEMADLRQYLNGRPLFPSMQPPDLLSGHRSLAQPYEMLMLPRGLHQEFRSSDSNNNNPTTAGGCGGGTGASTLCGFELEAGGGGGDGGGTGRWPRQETLTLLEIRSRLDPKFKEANQKGPLWDEVSRIMSEEHGYQRSGKKCREKFENLYKYYKKTKEGKAGRQDGKHYRFFRQLEALCGDQTQNAPSSMPETSFRYNHINSSSAMNIQEGYNGKFGQRLSADTSLSLSNSCDYDTTSSDDDDDDDSNDVNNNGVDEKKKKGRRKRNWKAKIIEFIDVQMNKMMEKQEAWMDKMMRTIEHKEQERLLREEEWRKEDAARIDREHKFWAKERAWIEARDAALMEAMQKMTGKQVVMIKASPPSQEEMVAVPEIRSLSDQNNHNDDGSETITNNNNTRNGEIWPDNEITRLIQLRNSMEQQGGVSEDVIWEEIAQKMSCFGYERSAFMCKEKWQSVNSNNSVYLLKSCNKKRKENYTKGCSSYYNDQCLGGGAGYCETSTNEQQAAVAAGANNAINDNCFRYFMGDAESLWDNYGLKLNKGDNLR